LSTSQVSTPLQYWPSLHAPLFGLWSQLSLTSLQLSVVHVNESLQLGAGPA
jgi:hypothetical protein